jgi:hypothetical protein
MPNGAAFRPEGRDRLKALSFGDPKYFMLELVLFIVAGVVTGAVIAYLMG